MCAKKGAMQESFALPPSSLHYVQPFARYIAPVLNEGALSPFGIANYVIGKWSQLPSARLNRFFGQQVHLKEHNVDEVPGLDWKQEHKGVKRESPDSSGSITARGELVKRVKAEDNPFLLFPSRRYRRQWRGW